MAASEYLSTKAEEGNKDPIKASVYTGSAYILTVLLIISPFLFLKNLFLSLGLSILNGILVILIFTFYVSVTNDIPFKRRFFETLSISLGVACLTFIIGFLVRIFWNIEV
jgi:VIT1/CCC1 family predicted Fe2+/Mn2+ transporter